MHGRKKDSMGSVYTSKQESDLIESFLEDKYRSVGSRSNNSKKSKYTSNSKLTKSSLFKTILKKTDSPEQRDKERQVEVHLLEGSLENVALQQKNFWAGVERAAEGHAAPLDRLIDWCSAPH